MNALPTALSASARILLVLATILAGVVPLAATQAGAQESGTVDMVNAVPTEIRSFEMTAGRPEWAQPIYERLGRTIFQFTSDGRFAMVEPDGYPTLVGTVGQDGTITASASSSVCSTGSTTTEMYGLLRNDGTEYVLEIRYVAGSTLAAVVNGTHFGSSSVKAYTATVVLSTQ